MFRLYGLIAASTPMFIPAPKITPKVLGNLNMVHERILELF
jgi:hypothetical protein